MVVIGAALGNVVRGVSLAKDGTFFAPLWTDFFCLSNDAKSVFST